MIALLLALLTADPPKASPLVVGETFTVESKVLGEARRINVYLPVGYATLKAETYPVLYVLDGGLAEDFLHIAGLVEVSARNGTVRPVIVVGIENTIRRRDLTGPTDNANDKKLSPEVGGSAAFRKFIRAELMPEVAKRYRTAKETAVVGESLAGLFVVETFFREPDLFDTYLAIDPSLWWNDEKLVKDATKWLRENVQLERKQLFLASSDEKGIAEPTGRLATELLKFAPMRLRWHHEKMPHETHGTIFHPAALVGLRRMLRPVGNYSPLVGEWRYKSHVANGKAGGAKELDGSRVVIAEDGTVSMFDGNNQGASGWITHVDFSRKPPQLEWELGGRSEFSGRFEPKYAQKGIFEVTKDTLRICITRDATQTPRPTAFESPAGKELVLQELVRIK
jgi:uncharacterized protein (TIGR03067 family)